MQNNEHHAAGGGDGELVFYQHTSNRNLGLISLICYLSMGTFTALAVWNDGPQDRRWLGVAVFGSFWLILASFSAVVLLGYWRGRLIVRGDVVRLQGALFNKQVDLKKVSAIRWQVLGLKLMTPEATLTVSLGTYKIPEPLPLIRCLRNRFPESMQEGWETFCYRTAIPLLIKRGGVTDKDRDEFEAAKGEQMTFYRRDGWYFVPAIVVGLVICVAGW